MMSDEEKKAIEVLQYVKNKTPFIFWYEDKPYNRKETIKTILNLIEKQSKEIERLNNKFEKIYNEIDNKNSQLVKALNYKLFMEDKIKAKIDYLLKQYDSENFINFEMFIKVLQSLLNEEE